MGVPTRRSAPHRFAPRRAASCRAAGNQLTDQLARVAQLGTSRRVASHRMEPLVESRRLQGSQIGLAKGAVWSEGAAALRERSERETERERASEREEREPGKRGTAGGCY